MNIEDYLKFYETENALYMPNEIFDDLQKNIQKSIHIPFAYSYYYLLSWLYRYAKYGTIAITNKEIKQILGYHPENSEMNYLMKKNGLLDQIGYTITDKNFPLLWIYDGDQLDFEMLYDQENKDDFLIGRNRKYTIKFPVKCFYRTKDSLNNNVKDGTFYSIENTHYVPFKVFLFCMNNKDIGTIGFYLWAYLKMQNQLYNGTYDVSLSQLAKEINLSERTMIRYLILMKKHNMIVCTFNQDYFSLDLELDKRKSNSYMVNDPEQFSELQIPISKMTVLKRSNEK